MMKKAILCFLLMGLVLPGGCLPDLSVPVELDFRVALVLSFGGLGDGAYNDMSYAGVQAIAKEFNIDFSFKEATDMGEFEEFHRGFAKAGYDLIIAVGSLQKSAVEVVAREFPETKFIILDSAALDELDTVVSVDFKSHEGAFLAGFLSGKISETGIVGFIGGFEVPVTINYQMGFEQGLDYADPTISLVVDYVGDDNDPEKGKEIAHKQYKEGVDIVFPVAGHTNPGVFEGAEETGMFAIGVDVDQDGEKPGTILTSVLKKLDQAVYYLVKAFAEGSLQGGIVQLGLAESCVGLTDFAYTGEYIPEDVRNELEIVKQKIIDGEIVVDQYR